MCSLQIVEGSRFTQQFPVDDRWEVDIQNDTVVDGDPKQQADQCELILCLERVWVEPTESSLLVKLKHTYRHKSGKSENEEKPRYVSIMRRSNCSAPILPQGSPGIRGKI